MPIQTISSLWTPDIWIAGIAEKQATFPSLLNSRAVVRTNLLTELASGPGTIANVPFLKDITDQPNEVQIEHTAPTTTQGAPGDVCAFPIMNRVTKSAWTAMAKNVSGADIMDHVFSSLAERCLKQYQTTLVAMLRGLCGTGAQANAAAATLADTRYGGTDQEPFLENGENATDNELMSPELFIKTKALLGELGETLMAGAMFIHTDVLSRLELLDLAGFNTPDKPSDLPFTIRRYRGVPLFTSAALRRAGNDGGFVYDTYILARSSVGFGEKPQTSESADLASLAYDWDKDLNDDLIWDRRRLALGVDGTAFTGNPAASSPTDAELGTVGNWSLKYQSANRVGIAAIRTNG